jgi:uncharacterized protein (TIGR02231 family)
MKKAFLYSSFLILRFSFTYAQPVIDLNPPVKSVTVYQSGAVITNETKVSLQGGKTTVVFHGLPSRIDVQSIQLASTGDLTILSVSSHEDYLNMNKKIGKIRLWQDSLDGLNENLEKVKNGIDILEDSKKMLDNNRTVGGVNTGTTVTNLKPMYDYYVHQVSHIDDSLITLKKKKKILDAKIQKIEKGMYEWRSQTDTLTSEVEAIVSSDLAQSVDFKLSYLTYDAGWGTLYDLRVKGTKDPAQLAYKANVYQHTGEDWTNVDLTLSTANPRVSQTAPELMPWYLRYYTPYNYAYSNGAGAPSMAKSQMAQQRSADIAQEDKPVYQNKLVENTTSENQLAVVEFHIEVPYSLPTDNKAHTVEIKNLNINPIYRYRSVPKLDEAAFLMADITQWENLNLLPGEVNVYYSGAYVGKSYLNTQNTSDTISFSLGRDKKIVVKREKVKDFSATKWIGASKSQTFGYTISLHNGHNDTLSVELLDQVPLSTDKDIVIELIDKGAASFDVATGKLKWKITLAAGETRKLTFSYSVKYPKDKTIENLW